MKIDTQAFLEALTGMVDCDSGYGACKPVSPAARSFLVGRYGETIQLASNVVRHGRKYNPEAHDAMREMALDLRSVALEIDAVLANTDEAT